VASAWATSNDTPDPDPHELAVNQVTGSGRTYVLGSNSYLHKPVLSDLLIFFLVRRPLTNSLTCSNYIW